jgi:two-component system, chemotaxis family, chemotaxis protein CheV
MAENEILLESGTNELEILEFYIDATCPHASVDGSEETTVERSVFGVNVAKVLEVIGNPGLVHSESAPHPCFMGLLSLREMTVPVLDLGIWLGMERTPHPHDVIIVTEFSQTVTGFLVSGVVDIHRFFWRSVQPPSGLLARFDDACMVGIVEVQDRFIQLIDLEQVIAEFSPESMLGRIEAQHEDAPRYRALVADDSKVIRTMITGVLQGANFDPHVVNNGEDGLRYIQELKRRALAEGARIEDFLDVVISDIEMPRMDGFSLTRQIKEDPVLSALPVILYSSLITPELLHKGHSVGADEQVSKPELARIPGIARRLIQEARGKTASETV